MIILILQRPLNCNKFSYSLIYNPAVGHNLVLDVYDDVELQMVRSSVDHLKARDGPPASWASTGQNLCKIISVQMSIRQAAILFPEEFLPVWIYEKLSPRTLAADFPRDRRYRLVPTDLYEMGRSNSLLAWRRGPDLTHG